MVCSLFSYLRLKVLLIERLYLFRYQGKTITMRILYFVDRAS
jgi:hypothetical protein